MHLECTAALYANPYVFIVLPQLYLNLLQPHGLYPARPPCLWDFSGKNTGVGCHFLLQAIFPTQGSLPLTIAYEKKACHSAGAYMSPMVVS